MGAGVKQKTNGISDRITRPIISGDKRALNKRIVEALANQVYDMELRGEPTHRIGAYRKAAWALEDTAQDLGLIYRQMGCAGLASIDTMEPRLAAVVRDLLDELLDDLAGGFTLDPYSRMASTRL